MPEESSGVINHPSHYASGPDDPYEVIKIIYIWGLHSNFCVANTLKYVARAGKKNPSKFLEDFKKALWYVQFFLEDDHSLHAAEEGRSISRWGCDTRPIIGELYRPDRVCGAWGIEEGSASWSVVHCLAGHHFFQAKVELQMGIDRLEALAPEETVETEIVEAVPGSQWRERYEPLQIAVDVQAFHTASRTPAPTVPAFPSMDRINLRKSLIQEEANELFKAIDERDMVETVDGLIDLLYVTTGTLLEFGVDPTPFWNEVQVSNMAKFPICKTCKGEKFIWVRGPGDEHLPGPCPDCDERGTVLILREHDKKILKPEGWCPPDIHTLLIEQEWKG